MTRIKNWLLRRKYKGHEEWENTESNVTLTHHNVKDNVYVSILGRGRYQPEYLVGGNSRRHFVSAKTAKEYDFIRTTKKQARKIALNYMRTHPRG